MKLYHFSVLNEKNRTLQFADWETDEVVFKREFSKMSKGWTVIDVGAQYGYYAIKAAHQVGNEGKVLAIEAHPRIYQVLRMNMKLYGLTGSIIPIWKAAGKEKGRTTLYESISPGGASIVSRAHVLSSKLDRNRLYSWLEFAKSGALFKIIRERFVPTRFIVPVDTIDAITKKFNMKVDLIKIDVEGAELDVLIGSHRVLERDRPILLVEVHFGYDWDPGTLYGLLRKLGYNLTIERRRLKAHVVAHPKRRFSKE